MNSPKPFRVLSLDGGGIRGLYTAHVLNNLFSHFNTPQNNISRIFDLIVGTSTGGILAAGIAAGIEFSTIINLYEEHGENIFTAPYPYNRGKVSQLLWVLKNLRSPAASAKHLRKALNESFGSLTLESIYKANKVALCIPSIKLHDHRLRIFKTPHITRRNNHDKAISLVDVCMATSAAPLIFPLHKVDYGEAHDYQVDGGLAANNPSLIGLLEALDVVEDHSRAIHIISIGTCANPGGDVITKQSYSRGVLDWKFGTDIVNVSLNAHSHLTEVYSNRVASVLTKSGRDIKVYRFPSKSRSCNQLSALQMDKADKQTLEALKIFAFDDYRFVLQQSKKCQNLAFDFMRLDLKVAGMKAATDECNSEQFFNLKGKFEWIDIEKLNGQKRSIEELEKCLDLMRSASQGLIPKRQPITVKEVDDTLKVTDGNTTVAALILLGVKRVPVEKL